MEQAVWKGLQGDLKSKEVIHFFQSSASLNEVGRADVAGETRNGLHKHVDGQRVSLTRRVFVLITGGSCFTNSKNRGCRTPSQKTCKTILHNTPSYVAFNVNLRHGYWKGFMGELGRYVAWHEVALS